MASEAESNDLGLDAALWGAIRSYLNCRQDHAPLPCYRRDPQSECVLQPMLAQWRQRNTATPRDEHPHVFALTQAGCHRNRAKMIMTGEGFEMSNISTVVAAHVSQAEFLQAVVPWGAQTCSQCQPGTNTFAWRGLTYRDSGACQRIHIPLAQFAYQLQEQSSSGKVLCVGAGGRLRFCGPEEFVAVSHVWEHGWQGVSEDGLCSRVLQILLHVASRLGVEWVWLDVAMISGQHDIRTMSINSMNRIYTTAKATLVCDRLLLSMQGGSDREKALALAASDWMTRVWTMQEALLSKNIYVAQRDQIWSTAELLQRLVLSPVPNAWHAYGAVRTLFGMVDIMTSDVETILERTVLLCRERTTTKQVDLARAFFPLFELQWPGPGTTLAEGQIRLLQHLGKHVSRCWGMFGPVGLPSPWAWAPLTFAGCSGELNKGGGGGGMTPEGLLGRWAWRQVQATAHEAVGKSTGRVAQNQGVRGLFRDVMSAVDYGSRSKWSNMGSVRDVKSVRDLGVSIVNDIYRGVMSNRTSVHQSAHAQALAALTGGACDFVTFSDPNGTHAVSAMVYSHPSSPFPWSHGKPLYLLTFTSKKEGEEWCHYDLAIVESSEEQRFRMHRVGSVFGPTIEMKTGDDSIQGLLF